MTVRERVLEAQLIEKVRKNPKLAEQMGITIEYPENNDNKIREDKKLLIQGK